MVLPEPWWWLWILLSSSFLFVLVSSLECWCHHVAQGSIPTVLAGQIIQMSLDSSRRRTVISAGSWILAAFQQPQGNLLSRPLYDEGDTMNGEADEQVVLSPQQHPFVYSCNWTGTRLPRMSLDEAVQDSNLVVYENNENTRRKDSLPFTSFGTPLAPEKAWRMARWADPCLRQPAEPVDSSWFGTVELSKACRLLETTALKNGAVGLAAQQCGVNARIIYLKHPSLIMINPRIVNRSPELEMRVWREECLVLPPSFRATVLRDAWVDVQYQNCDSESTKARTFENKIIRLRGEAARALQHEYDHDRGILITDHVDLNELETTLMQDIERPGHAQRMMVAYQRTLDEPLS